MDSFTNHFSYGIITDKIKLNEAGVSARKFLSVYCFFSPVFTYRPQYGNNIHRPE